SIVATDHVPDRRSVEKAEATLGVSFDKISNGAPGIETLLALVYSGGVARKRITVERMVDLLSTTPARLFGFGSKGAIEPGRDGDKAEGPAATASVVREVDGARRRVDPRRLQRGD